MYYYHLYLTDKAVHCIPYIYIKLSVMQTAAIDPVL